MEKNKQNWVVVALLGLTGWLLWKKQVSGATITPPAGTTTPTTGGTTEEPTFRIVQLRPPDSNWQVNKEYLLKKYNLTLINEGPMPEMLIVGEVPKIWVLVKGRRTDIYNFAKEVKGFVVLNHDLVIEELQKLGATKPIVKKDRKYYCPYGGEELFPICLLSPISPPLHVGELSPIQMFECPNGHGLITITPDFDLYYNFLITPEQFDEIYKIATGGA